MHCKHIIFESGGFVLLLSKHLPLKLPGSHKPKPLWLGLYQIVYSCGDNAYELELPATLAKLHSVFNLTLFQRYVGDVVPALDLIKLDDGSEYKVHDILYHQWAGLQRTYLEYLVTFIGYDASHNDWLTAANLANTLDIFCSYQNAHGLA